MKTSSFELATYENGNKDAERVAVILPGRLDTKDYIHIHSLVDYLGTLGYYALSFDPPGTWESPGGINLYTTTNIQLAIAEIVERLGNRPTLLAGHSRGGSHALLSGVVNPNVTHMVAIMSHAGPTTTGLLQVGQVAHSTRDMPPGGVRTVDRKEFDLPYHYFEDQQQYDATESLKTCPKPKLFFYGLHDDLVTPETVKEVYNLSADPKVLHALDTEHDYRLDPSAIEEVNHTIGTFLHDYEAV
jgi:hypothetical protein